MGNKAAFAGLLPVPARLLAVLKFWQTRTLPPARACMAAAAAGLFPFSAHADRETQAQILQLQTQVQDMQVRLARIEAVLQGQGLLTLYNDIQTIKEQMAKLNGMSEVQGHQLDQLDRRQLDLYQSLDQRITAQAVALEKLKTRLGSAEPASPAAPTSAAGPAAANPGAAAAAPAPALSETQTYEAALARFKKGDFRGAAEDFRNFQRQFPSSSLAANAQFWVGYSLYSRKDYKAAIGEMHKLLAKYPQTPKAPDALLTVASCQVELNQLPLAKRTLKDLVSKYPHSSAAGIARKRLELLK